MTGEREMTGVCLQKLHFDTGRLSLERDGQDWPNRDASRFIFAGGLRWHFQRMGDGLRPTLLLVHGAGAATHSWRALAPLLAEKFDVVAVDLPGHGFSEPMPLGATTLPDFAKVLQRFTQKLAIRPAIVVGHSAGAAILARMSLDHAIAPRLLISLNGAFLPFEGFGRLLFPAIAKLLFLNPLTPHLFALAADRSSVERLLRGTGSKIDSAGVDFYTRLLKNPAHVAGVLAMMANWRLEELQDEFRRLSTPLALIAAAEDKAVPPETADRIGKIAPHAEIKRLSGLGHLAHEERPEQIADIIFSLADRAGVNKC